MCQANKYLTRPSMSTLYLDAGEGNPTRTSSRPHLTQGEAKQNHKLKQSFEFSIDLVVVSFAD